MFVTESTCKNCTTQYYNPTASTTSAPSTAYTLPALGYGTAKFVGYMNEDTMCLSNANTDTCVNNFPFFVIQNQDGFKDLDGVIGMSPPAAANGPSFISYLYAQGKLAAPVVSFQINIDADGEQSVAQFGYTDSSSYSGALTTHNAIPY